MEINKFYSKQNGFTLLEILLVIVIISVTAAMVIPSFVNMSQGNVNDEVRRLQQSLRLASEEAQMTGLPMRWTARKYEYSFEVLNSEQAWVEMSEPPFLSYDLPQDVMIAEVNHAGIDEKDFLPDDEEDESENGESEDREPVIGRLIFWPDGMLTTSEVILAYEDEALDEVKHLQLRPGPGGIEVVQEAP